VPRVLADAHRLERVLVILLGAALQRSPPGVPIDVRLVPAGEEIVLEIEDRGERSGRAVSAERPAAGAQPEGLNLHVARLIVEAHGGSLAAGAGGRGTLVRVRLPLRPPGSDVST
jgi:two-component system OmpR family sensor kinase